jgi:ABC-2 type transport system permease protein
MNTMKWLVKREYWENKGGIFWAQAIVGLAFAVILTIGIALIATGITHSGGMNIDGVSVREMSGAMTQENRIEAAAHISMAYLPITGLLLVVMAFVVFFYSLSSLYDDRKDKSVLFWKSMPTSDTQTVLSKLFTILVITPLVPLAVGLLVSTLVIIVINIAALFLGVNLFGAVLTTANLYLLPLQILACLPVYIIWAFPSVAWFMMVSAWARRLPILWAVGIPVIFGVLISITEGMLDIGIPYEWYWENIVGRLFGGFVPGTWFAFFDVTSDVAVRSHSPGGADILQASWAIFGYSKVWIAAALGATMTYAAIRLRSYRDEG